MHKRFYKEITLKDYKPGVFSNINPNNERSYEYSINQTHVEDSLSEGDDFNYLKKQLEERLLKVDEIERQAYEKGFEAGEKSGFEMGIEKAKVLLEQIKNLLDELTNLKERMIKANEKKMVALAVSIAEKIINKKVDEDETIIFNILSNALKKIQRQEKIKITINPSIQVLIEKFKIDIGDICPKIVIDIDPNVNKNFIKLESETEEIVVDFEKELLDITKTLSSLF